MFAITGAVVLDDYGLVQDSNHHRQTAAAVANYALGASEEPPGQHINDRYYGMAFQMPMLLTERALSLQDTRHIYLMRHLVTHLFFIAGGFACGMLAYRMFGSRWMALFAMLMFLLHPRLYAHSFFNSMDVPFAAMLLIALYLAHRAFRKDTLGAFLLCGISVGLAINLRVFGLMLPPLILAMRGLDLWQASRAERKRILASAGIFAGAALAVVYIIHLYYWENPLRFVEGIRVLSQHPTIGENLFMGEIYRSDAVPWNYIPVWFAITAPPVALALGALGAAAVSWQTIAHPLAALRDRETRFRVLSLCYVVLPVAVAIALQSNIYNGWRHMYFLWGPFCLLAAVGLHTITNIRMRRGIWKIGARLPGWVHVGGRWHMARRGLAYGVAGVGLATTLTAMAALHPYEYVYFNALVDTNTPGALGKRYEMDYWEMAQRQSLEYLLDRYPDDTLRVWPKVSAARMLPQSDRERILVPRRAHEADYLLHPIFGRRNLPEESAIHSVRAYGSGIAFILDSGSYAYRDYYRAQYADVEANGTLLARSVFDIYIHDGALHYLKENCEPLLANANLIRVFLHIFPADRADLLAERREYGFENRNFWLSDSVAFFDGKCFYKQPPLPDYSIARIETGQFVKGELAWRADIDLAAHAAATALYENISAGDYEQPLAQSDFDVYLRGNGLAYLKEPCEQDDMDARFFLHIIPDDPADLPAVWREYGFENLDFRFADHGAYAGDKCVAERELPDYPIARIKTGQNAAASGGYGWLADINLAARPAAQAAYDGIAAGEYGQPVAQSDFDVYLRGNTLAYIKEHCDEGDTDARFLLHIIPANPANLSADRRARGFDNLDFQFADHGALIGGKCVATLELPDYAIDRIRTGQFVSDEGSVWGANIDLAAQSLYESIVAGDYGQPVAQSDFDVYLRGNTLAYLKEHCAKGDTDARFFLHIIPANPADLPAPNRERGFANLDFHFADHGAYAGDKCVAAHELPDYPIERIRTGQFVSGEGQVWSAGFSALP